MAPRETPSTAIALGDWLRELRERSGLSQADAAEAVGAEPRDIRRWENEESRGRPVVPSGLALLRMLSAYGVTITPAPPAALPSAVNAELRRLANQLEGMSEKAARAAEGRMREIAAEVFSETDRASAREQLEAAETEGLPPVQRRRARRAPRPSPREETPPAPAPDEERSERSRGR